uniref:PCI domain-containing protein n=1 Tax=Alexandrium andersonii TaxID=327968 RepID=A0A7S2HYQ0_9DINO|mmetsp:Transcript_76654/g.171486  ORF Transcript_76654/g.171486 Transcript_76654/m.171486 type:complete len:336 (+) Transcript_76654:72-1079(+)
MWPRRSCGQRVRAHRRRGSTPCPRGCSSGSSATPRCLAPIAEPGCSRRSSGWPGGWAAPRPRWTRRSGRRSTRGTWWRLHHDKRRRDGGLAICCELLRLYYRLGQASQCSPMLKKLSHGQGGESLDFAALPAALAVTLCFLWGKHLVLEGDVLEAEKKLTWALEHCPPKAAANRRRILGYLVPCRLRMGQSPGPRLLRKHSLEYMEGIVRAVMQGDVRLFDSEFARLESKLVGVGTILVVEKLKLVAYWNLCRRVHGVAAANLKAEGKKEEQQDLGLYECAFKWQDGCDPSETLSLLANLMFLGAVRGSIYYERRKIVFSKVTPFPKVSEWCGKV